MAIKKIIHILLPILLVSLLIGFILYSKTYSTIEGSLSFPANNTPIQTVCVINQVTKDEKCTEAYVGKNDNGFPMSFTIKVKPGIYSIYSTINDAKSDERWNNLVGYKAFYTKYSNEDCYGSRDENKKEKCIQFQKDKNPILINAYPGQKTKVMKFDWYPRGIDYEDKK